MRDCEDGSTTLCRNVGNHLQIDAEKGQRRTESLYYVKLFDDVRRWSCWCCSRLEQGATSTSGNV